VVPLPDALTTARLQLTAWTEGDRDLLAELVTDPRVVRFVRNRLPWPVEFLEQRHRDVLEQWAAYGFGWRAILRRDNADRVGLLAINRRSVQESPLATPAVELGWFLVPRAWGLGFATEAARAARDEVFDAVGADLLFARYQVGNTASGAVMNKLGLRYQHDHDDAHGYRHHVHLLTRADWLSARDAG
jgi:[ribosomal protein S5]-alanine N-acetyltransferase